MTKHHLLAVFVGTIMVLAGSALAQRPKQDVSAERHPNIAAAQRFTQQAWDRIGAAQRANEWDMAGHAKRAKELLEQADKELKLAAEAANRNR